MSGISKRITFGFDEQSFELLQEAQEEGRYSSMAEVIRDSLGIFRALQEEVEEGYTELVVRDPRSKSERVLVVPSLKRVQ